MKKYLILLFLLFSVAWQNTAFAALNLILTQGIDTAIPIAIVPFDDNLVSIISHDLKNSGRFKLLATSDMPSMPKTLSEVEPAAWKNTAVDYIVIGSAQKHGSELTVTATLVSLYPSPKALWQDTFTVEKNRERALAHHIADKIYQKLIGIPGIFSTRLAYVLVQPEGKKTRYSLMISDADGANPRAILKSDEPIMSPAWSHDGKKIAYVSFEDKHSQIYISDLATGNRQLVSHFLGINGAPAWSPNDQELAMVLSKSGSPNIYVMNLKTHQLRQLTQGSGINTEPVFTPDGQSIVFTSDRAGRPQLFKIDLKTGQIERVTFSGHYNARANFSADGKQLLMLHGDENGFNIATQDMDSGKITLITRSGRNDSPSLSPNGSMVLYGTEFGELGMVSTDGRINLRIPAGDGQVRSPAWSGYLNKQS